MNNKQAVEVGGFAGWMLSALRRGREGFAQRKAVKTLQMVETLSLGGRRQVVLVRCGSEQFLVGTSGDGVSTIVPVKGAGELQ